MTMSYTMPQLSWAAGKVDKRLVGIVVADGNIPRTVGNFFVIRSASVSNVLEPAIRFAIDIEVSGIRGGIDQADPGSAI